MSWRRKSRHAVNWALERPLYFWYASIGFFVLGFIMLSAAKVEHRLSQKRTGEQRRVAYIYEDLSPEARNTLDRRDFKASYVMRSLEEWKTVETYQRLPESTKVALQAGDFGGCKIYSSANECSDLFGELIRHGAASSTRRQADYVLEFKNGGFNNNDQIRIRNKQGIICLITYTTGTDRETMEDTAKRFIAIAEADRKNKTLSKKD